ncbi:MAG: HAMP domain-containing histidine kinase [Bacilli bacterium]|nr:HAMP domain-containing histidine kinase [Bacilli bacterium]
MWKMKSSINHKILTSFLLFTILILGILWLFQFLFLNSFYKDQKINDIKSVVEKIKKNQTINEINEVALDKSICVEIANKNYDVIYSSRYFGKGCISGNDLTNSYKFDFISNNKEEETYEMIHEKYKSKTLVYGVKLDNNNIAFLSTSLEPTKGIISIIRKQLIVITVISIILSYLLAILISNHISKPIKEISNEAKNLANGNYNPIKEESNIEEIEELKNTLNDVKEELSKTDELRRDLMANVSHDLKTPLTMIKAYAEMSMDLHSNNEEKRKQDMNTIIQETDRLTILVNDILELSKMQSNMEIEKEEFDLIELTKEILQRYQLYQETENYQFIFNHNKESIMILADKKKIEQVIYNLINNAINYTGEDNKVEINIKEEKDILVEIKDTGKGIKEEDLPYIWDRYYKNKKKHKRNLIGTGLGLNIVKTILETHNYPYGVKTKKDKGTTFYFKTPKTK